MRAHAVCHRGCPDERETHYQCIAYKENGRLCKQPAMTLDPARGGFVCERHKAKLIDSLRTEAALQPQSV
jgi:hypothetical protein